MTITDDQLPELPDLHGVLDLVFRVLAREDGYVDSGPNWVRFLSADAYLDVEEKLGNSTSLSISAYLLDRDGVTVTEAEVLEWVSKQPHPVLGVLSVGRDEHDDGSVTARPLIRFEIRHDSIVPDFIDSVVLPFADAWENGGVAEVPAVGDLFPYRVEPATDAPRNAWLLMASEASYPTPEELAEMWDDGVAGIFDTEWTAPKNGEFGDLVLVYFVAPRKAAHFVARMALRPFWESGLEVNADATVDPHQWWVYLTPLVEIEPIAYKELQQAHNGDLPLRGRSGHYLPSKTIAALTFKAVRPEQQAEVDRIVQIPVGMAELPDKADTTFEEWKAIPGGLLPLEASVSEHVVWPLARLLDAAPYLSTAQMLDGTLGPIVTPEYRVPSGFVDFVFDYGGPPAPALAVEVKLTLLRPASGVWSDSPDFRQLRRYMDDLDVPGLLVDAQRLLLVRPGADGPFAEIVRSNATWGDIALIRDLMLEGCRRKSNERPSRPSRPTRRVFNRG
ncbi:hypothetical protein [Leifsonia sp. NPDC058248]|uniref:hypothetical protein n=1 Tax=Leifsonia sp. NPDC058248 TaxID=3346402 RepID=UPI0036D92BC7